MSVSLQAEDYDGFVIYIVHIHGLGQVIFLILTGCDCIAYS